MPRAGTTKSSTKAPKSLIYGSFGNTNTNILKKLKINEQLSPDSVPVDNDSGMSSEETDESLKYDLSANLNNKVSNPNIIISNDVIKCLTTEPQCAGWNEIPCCSNNVSISVVNEEDTSGLDLDDAADEATDTQVSDFIVIDVACDVNDPGSDCEEKLLGTNSYNDCDNLSIHSVDTSQMLVPVANNELMTTENQKLVSLSLSILLAALLQAVRCFAQFLEDIVVPQR